MKMRKDRQTPNEIKVATLAQLFVTRFQLYQIARTVSNKKGAPLFKVEEMSFQGKRGCGVTAPENQEPAREMTLVTGKWRCSDRKKGEQGMNPNPYVRALDFDE
ncbi:high osmolarity signaling protein SHO1 [Striga asiatica]|uniref:High osmolarity signaling protein SHO1 n=1 Tax=Striga asiatica TaxID=4170 RepID=A0A5A7RD95_STRAF|nr:high osmolarity signaling protein SHO1 [Striga asiatica]